MLNDSCNQLEFELQLHLNPERGGGGEWWQRVVTAAVGWDWA